MTHGKRPHKIHGVCHRKGATFTTWDAAMAAVVQTPGAERPYRGECCGYWHISSTTQDQYAQLVAEHLPPRLVARTWEDDEGEEEEAGRGEPRAGEGDDGQAPVERSGEARLAPSPREVAKRIARRRRPPEY